MSEFLSRPAPSEQSKDEWVTNTERAKQEIMANAAELNEAVRYLHARMCAKSVQPNFQITKTYSRPATWWERIRTGNSVIWDQTKRYERGWSIPVISHVVTDNGRLGHSSTATKNIVLSVDGQLVNPNFEKPEDRLVNLEQYPFSPSFIAADGFSASAGKYNVFREKGWYRVFDSDQLAAAYMSIENVGNALRVFARQQDIQ